MGKRPGKEELIKKMRDYPHKCDVEIEGHVCVYAALYYSEIKKHIQNHRNSIGKINRSNALNNPRRFEVPIQVSIPDEVVSEKSNGECKLTTAPESDQDQVHRIIVFGKNGESVSIEQESFLEQFEQKFIDQVITVDEVDNVGIVSLVDMPDRSQQQEPTARESETNSTGDDDGLLDEGPDFEPHPRPPDVNQTDCSNELFYESRHHTESVKSGTKSIHDIYESSDDGLGANVQNFNAIFPHITPP